MNHLLTLITHLTNPDVLLEYVQYLVLIVLIFSFLEVVIPPIPGDTVLIVGSSIAGLAGINPIWIIISSFTGTFIASLLLYNLGARFEHKLLESPKYAWLLDSKAFTEIEKWFNRFGYWTLLLSRFLPIARSGVVLAAGIVNFDKQRTLLALSISILLSSTTFVFIGRFLGRRWKEAYLEWGPRFQIIIAILIGSFALIAIVIGFWKLRKNNEKGN